MSPSNADGCSVALTEIAYVCVIDVKHGTTGRMIMTENLTEERYHWEHREDENGVHLNVIVCDQPECDYEATAYASQFAVHHMRRHERWHEDE